MKARLHAFCVVRNQDGANDELNLSVTGLCKLVLVHSSSIARFYFVITKQNGANAELLSAIRLCILVLENESSIALFSVVTNQDGANIELS